MVHFLRSVAPYLCRTAMRHLDTVVQELIQRLVGGMLTATLLDEAMLPVKSNSLGIGCLEAKDLINVAYIAGTYDVLSQFKEHFTEQYKQRFLLYPNLTQFCDDYIDDATAPTFPGRDELLVMDGKILPTLREI